MMVLVDPGLTSTNLGDRIISQAVHENFVSELQSRGTDVVSLPLHGPIDHAQRRQLRAATDVVVSGTNLLSSHMRFRSPWTWSRSDVNLTSGKLTVFGAGWWQYQTHGIDWMTGRWLRSLGSHKQWAVRDVYSAKRLEEASIRALHTSCPSLWAVRVQRMPGGSTRVVATFTDYTQDRASDAALITLLRGRFDEVRLWPQGPGDSSYFKSLGVPSSAILGRTVEAFDNALAVPDTAYVGLRLHGGIRAAQLNIPSLILSVDNRAREIGRSIGLVCPSRHSLSVIRPLLESTDVSTLRLPHQNISAWLAQWTHQ